jgi:hypothetical protein
MHWAADCPWGRRAASAGPRSALGRAQTHEIGRGGFVDFMRVVHQARADPRSNRWRFAGGDEEVIIAPPARNG